jgi:hypothetical protein
MQTEVLKLLTAHHPAILNWKQDGRDFSEPLPA